jgi:folate-binding protein YgfZ
MPELTNPLRSAAAVISLEDFGVFDFIGSDASGFLHRLLSNEIRNLAVGEGIPACFLHREGRILLDLTLWKTDLGYRALLAGKQREQLIPLFDRVLFREDVKIRDQSPECSFLVLAGPEATEVLGIASQKEVPPCEMLRSVSFTIQGELLTAFRVDWLQVPTYLMCSPCGIAADVLTRLKEGGALPTSLDAFHILRMEKGTPWPGFEVDDSMIPYECGLEGSVSLTKGCYVGQEIIARMHNLGKPPRLLRGLVLGTQQAPPRGAAVFHGEIEIGRVLGSGVSDALGCALATSSVRSKFSEDGTQVSVEDAPATVRVFPLA